MSYERYVKQHLCENCHVAFLAPTQKDANLLKCIVCDFTKKKDNMEYISMDEYLMGRQVKYPLDDEQTGNANTIVPSVNQLLACFYKDHPEAPRRAVTSGYRPDKINQNVPGAAKKSNHILCAAIDLSDLDGLLGNWCLKHLDLLERYSLWMEDFNSTHGVNGHWCHLQCKPPKSGKRTFLP